VPKISLPHATKHLSTLGSSSHPYQVSKQYCKLLCYSLISPQAPQFSDDSEVEVIDVCLGCFTAQALTLTFYFQGPSPLRSKGKNPKAGSSRNPIVLSGGEEVTPTHKRK